MAKVVIVYKGFVGEAERDSGNRYQGVVLGAAGDLHFEGDNLAELQSSFTQVVRGLARPTARESAA